MTIGSIARRFWRSFTGGMADHRPPAGVRGSDGYTLWQRFWASFIGVDLPARHLPTVSLTEFGARASPTSEIPRGGSRTGPLAPGWFRMPRLPEVGGLVAAGSHSALLEVSSPDSTARFLVHGHGNPAAVYSLEIVARGIEGTAPLMGAVRYAVPDGPERILLVPVAQERFGPAASYVRLPDFGVEAEWTAAVPVAVGPDSAWDLETVAASIDAALNEATRVAWRRVRARVGDDSLRRVIDEALR